MAALLKAISRIENHAEDIRLSTMYQYSKALGMKMKIINPASTGVGAYAAYLMGLEFIDEQSPV